MYTFRFNASCNQWILLGEPLPSLLTIQKANLITQTAVGHTSEFVAATYPRQPFVLDAVSKPGSKSHEDLVYAEQPPYGEYELLLHTGSESFFNWTGDTWEDWLSLLAERLRQIRHNHHVHYVSLVLHTAGLHTAGPQYQRVGDVIAASHPLTGMGDVLPSEVIEKIREKEQLFVVHSASAGDVYVPSAPRFSKELWLLPTAPDVSIGSLNNLQRKGVAKLLSTIFRVLHTEFPGQHFVMRVNTDFEREKHGHSWWIQIHEQENASSGTLSVVQSPERFVLLMRQILAHDAVAKPAARKRTT